MKHLSYLNKYFLKYKWRLSLGIFFIIVTNLFAISSPKIVEYAFNVLSEAMSKYKQAKETGTVVAPQSLSKLEPYWNNLHEFLPFNAPNDYLQSIGKLTLILGGLYLLIALLKGVFLFFTRQTIIIMSRLIEFDLKNEIFKR